MGLTGIATLIVAVAIVLGFSLSVLLFWGRLDALGRGRWPARVALLASCQLSAVLLTALVLNNAFVFYQSWSELLGTHPKQSRPSAQSGNRDAELGSELLRHFHAGVGTLVSLPIAGVRSGVRTGPATVYLPPQYGDPASADRSFPVVELLSGFPGGPATWTHTLHLASVLNTLIDTGRSVPFIAVAPVQNVDSPRDTECVDVVGGPKVDTYLAFDVRTAVEQAFRASRSGTQWTAMGDSTGGYCASDLSMRHPGMFSAAVSMAGYDAPAHDATTGNLFGKDPELANSYSLLWMAKHRMVSPLHLLLITTKPDGSPNQQARMLVSVARPPLELSRLILPRGGHNFGTFGAEIPVGFSWLSRFVSAPLAPIPTIDGLSPQVVPYQGGKQPGYRHSGPRLTSEPTPPPLR
ncbi:MAG: alpha/beta hydrolase-fold protein [Actinomycetota bacterium]|nr:alpha/beta hydrolase-fold protein [Actinomycetota bacterium]MDQ2958781.1 alpha/beta hydrolase-fold protein [Actinomycetota bacterium]